METLKRRTKKEINPVCGMDVDKGSGGLLVEFDGRTFYFCAEGCRSTFEKNPDKFVSPKREGIWARYLERLNRAAGGKPPNCCH